LSAFPSVNNAVRFAVESQYCRTFRAWSLNDRLTDRPEEWPAWRKLLSDAAWEQLLAPATDEREMVRHYTLSSDDRALIAAKRTEATQLGFAIMLSTSGIQAECSPPARRPAPMIGFVARQLGVSKDAVSLLTVGAMKLDANIWPN
jgi:hypothetical protein